MEKISSATPDLVQANIEAIAELFPNVVIEALDAEDNLTRSIDFDQLRQELSDHVVDGPQERYQLNWPGKRAASLAANAPTRSMLRPMLEESIDFENTKNVFIEGDNLEALKLLQESYLGKIKLIYIDPPYNTGNDFIYNDDFAETTAEYLERSGQTDESGNQLLANTESNGRFHSDWLSMMYPRLKLARNLLTEDGVLLVSIDDHEIDNLRKICTQIFGENNFIAELVWVKKEKASGVPPKNMLLPNFEFIVAVKRGGEISFKGQERSLASYKQDKDGRWWRTMPIQATGAQNSWFTIVDPVTDKGYHGNWAFSEQKIRDMVEAGKIRFPKNDDGKPVQVVFADEMANDKSPIFANLGKFDSETSTKQLIALMGGKKYFDFPKPLDLMTFLVDQLTGPHDIVLDFFAGSGTTAHAVMEVNAQDGGSRRWICVQIPEETPNPSASYNDGFLNLAQLARERIRRAGLKVGEVQGLVGMQLDTGFRSLRIDSGGYIQVLRTPEETSQIELGIFAENIKQDRNDLDLLFQVMVNCGLDLSHSVQRIELCGQAVLDVDESALIACFSHNLDTRLVKTIAERFPLRAVFRDSSFKSDQERINVEQIFREVSSDTQVRVI